MAETKYGHLMKNLTFEDYGPGSYRQGTKMDGKFLGYDVCIEYGAYWSAGKIGKSPYDSEKHDFDQVMVWMGTNTIDLGYLGAEVEMMLGEEMELQMIATSTAVAIPRGLQHMPATINRMENRFISMTVSVTPEMKSIPVHSDKAPTWPQGFQGHYKENTHRLAFERNGPWHYGPKNPDTHAGAITDIKGKDFEFHMSYESMNKAPYRFGPIPDKPHVHPYTEFLLFMGADCNDLSYLGAEVEVYMGKEMEKHVVTKPCVAIQPKGHPHCPVIVNKQEKPWIFAVVRPWGHQGEGQSGYLP
jgi:hypothetical protein